MNNEILAKARAAKSPEELLKIARDSGISDLNEENAKEYFDRLHKSGEMSDDELDVSAGGCGEVYGKKKISSKDSCDGWRCKYCAAHKGACTCGRSKFVRCDTCMYASVMRGQWYCNKD